MTLTANPQAGDPVRLPKKKLPPLIDVALPAVAVASGVMLALAVPNIVEGHDVWAYAKAVTLAGSATIISFAVNKLAIERGAPLATTGYWAAGVTSILSILAVGGGLFAATYSGLVFKDVAELQLQQHGTALSTYVAGRSAAAAEAGRVGPVMRSIVADLEQKTVCEREESCISGRGNGGRGPVARVMEEVAGRAVAVSQQLRAGDAARQEIVGRLNEAIADYQTTLGDSGTGVWERRGELQKIDARIGQAVGDLNEAVPLAMLSAYAAELKGGTTIAGRPDAEARLNGILVRYGETLSSVIASIDAGTVSAPVFPKRTGVSDTFGYFSHFLPVAAITAVVELIFPLVLWAYTFWSLSWQNYLNVHKANAGQPQPRSNGLDRSPAPRDDHRDRHRRHSQHHAVPMAATA